MKKLIIAIIPFLPFIASAQGLAETRTIKGIATKITSFLSAAVMPMLFTIALAWFIWGIVEFMRNAENSEERSKGKQRMLWGILALVAMVTFLGLTSVVTKTVFNNSTPFLPQLYDGQN